MQLLIIDDHPMTGAGLKSLLQSHYPAAGITTWSTFLAAELASKDWDYIFLDMHLPGHTFRKMLDDIGAQLDRVILISAYPEQDDVELARQRGVRGLLPKNIDIERILDGFQRIQAGENIFLDAQGMAQPGTNPDTALPTLTERQKGILEAVMGGLSNKQIARRLGISEYTVKEHVTAILAAYGVRNRLELILRISPR